MKYAIYMPPGDAFAEPRSLVSLALDAEQAGWDGFFIWVGGFWPNKAPMRLAAHYDGVYPLFNVWQDPEKLAAFKDAVAFVHARKPTAQPFDILVIGRTESSQDTEAAKAYQNAGATWWMEAVDPWSFGWADSGPWPVEAMIQRVKLGPPRIV
jgi:hypothetical protein